MLVDSTCSENDRHWSRVNYSSPTDAVVHMFHGGLWGGWQFAVDSVAAAPPPSPAALAGAAAAAPPPGPAIWLDASTIAGVADGTPLALWPDASGFKRDASQPAAAKRPTYVARGLAGGLPAVRFAGAQVLAGGGSLPATTTMLAVVTDAGSTTAYCSGVFTALGGLNSLCTQRATADSPAPDDDDPPLPGSSIVATALDWGGSPVHPGHRDLLHKPTVLAASYAPDQSTGSVDGCLELTASPGEGAPSQGFMVGSRNDEDGRYLVGDVSEVLVYARALNASELQLAVAYLAAKWGVSTPKHCAGPPPPPRDVRINFGYGGYQEARGSGVNGGQHAYIENVLEELDAPGEFFFDAATSRLFVLPNMSLPELQAATLAVPLLNSVVVINGSAAGGGGGGYATSISFAGFEVTQTRVTFLEQFEVPSGGDWAVHRGGALLVQDAENVTLAGLVFDQVGGNAIVLSNHVAGSTVADNEVRFAGDSAVVSIGSTRLIDGSAPTFPTGNTIARNHLHETGIYVKQSSCVALQLSANTSVLDNVCYNGPRAGFNVNDGLFGGHLFKGNVVFNSVRETGDHGAYNSWDRQPYLTLNGVDDGFHDAQGRSIIKLNDTQTGNLLLNGYNGVWSIDHDDGSQFQNDDGNMLVFGGCKNYLGHHKRCINNVIIYPGTGGRSAGGHRCQTDDNGVFAEQFYEGNVCASEDGRVLDFASCTASNVNTTAYATALNTYLVDAGAALQGPCGTGTFAKWQSLGQDAGSAVAQTPSVAALIALGAAKVLGA